MEKRAKLQILESLREQAVGNLYLSAVSDCLSTCSIGFLDDREEFGGSSTCVL